MRHATLALAVTLLAGCVNPLSLITKSGFGPLTPEQYTLLVTGYTPFAPQIALKAPWPTTFQAPAYPGVVSGNLDLTLVHGRFTGDVLAPDVVADLTTLEVAKGPGASGTFRQAQEAAMRPWLTPLGPNPVLTRTNILSQTPPGTLDMDTPSLEGDRWLATYTDATGHSVLHFHVNFWGTTVYRLGWTVKRLDEVKAPITREAAIEALEEAIRTPSFKGLEERSGKDHFFGHAFKAETRPAEANAGAAYELPPGTRWEARLIGIKGKLAWSLLTPVTQEVEAAYGASPSPSPSPSPTASPAQRQVLSQPPPTRYVPERRNKAFGLVDAQTGEVIRFHRPYDVPKGQYGNP